MIDLVAIGHVTYDETPSGVRPGGSAYYAAVTARRLGLGVGLLTSLSPDYPLDVFPDGIHVTTVASPRTTRYRLGESRGARTLTLLSRAADLGVEDLPAAWRAVSLAMLCPVAGEVDPALAGAFEDAAVAMLPQGWMRKRGRGGLIGPQPWEDADDLLPQTQATVALNKVRFLGAGPAEATFELLALVGLSMIYFSAGVWRFQKMHLKAA